MNVHVRYPEEPRLIVHDSECRGHWVVEMQPSGLWRVWTGTHMRGNTNPNSPWAIDFLKEEDVTAEVCGTTDGVPDVLVVLRRLEEGIRDLIEQEEEDV